MLSTLRTCDKCHIQYVGETVQKLNVTFSGSLHKKLEFPIKYFFNKYDQIPSFLWILSHLLKKYLMEFSYFYSGYRTEFQPVGKYQLCKILSLTFDEVSCKGTSYKVHILKKLEGIKCINI